MPKEKILILCEHNSARSQMAEAFFKQLAEDRFEVESAGIEPGTINPLAVEVMKEVGIDISGKVPQSVFDLYRQGKLYSYVITVCDEASEKCPMFPGITERLHWPFDDPSRFEGSWDERQAKTRAVRDQILHTIEQWLDKMDKESEN